MGIVDELGLRTMINAAGPVTRLGGHRLSEEVVAAMAEASRLHLAIDELQTIASRRIADVTGAEAGHVTSGASAALCLAAAACVARYDIALMDRLPDTGPQPAEVIVQRAHRTSYDHALRAAGVRLVEVGTLGYPGAGRTDPWQLEAAISPRTVAFAYAVLDSPGTIPLADVAAIAHRHNLPVIVDAAASLPPVANLRRFISDGADLVAFSGGKAICGPQASGILCGRQDLVESAALQHLDMDVHAGAWSRTHLIESGVLAGTPTHGLGRPMKVGKETIVGLLIALRRFVEADHDREARRQVSALEQIADAVRQTGVTTTVRGVGPPRSYPVLEIEFDDAQAHGALVAVRALQRDEPRVFVREGRLDSGVIVVAATALADEEVEIVGLRLAAAVRDALHSPSNPGHPREAYEVGRV